jgi:cobalt-zinc-cadmium efflux system protein
LAALANALLLMVAVGAIGWESMTRLQAPAPVASTTVIIVASVGIAINFATALLFLKGQEQDINIRGAFLHMLADAGVSLAVVIGGIAIYLTQFYWIDPAISLLIVAIILWSSWGLLKEAVRMALGGVPRNVDIDAVQAMLEAQPGVSVVHDLHVWPMSTSETALTAHLVMPDGHPGRAFLQALERDLRAAFPIHHSTIQIELEDEEALCPSQCNPNG